CSPLSRSRCRSSAATATWPGCGRAAWYAAAKATSVPRSASTDIAAATLAVRIRQQQRPDGTHHLGPVQQRQAFLGPKGQRFQADLAERQQPRHDLAVE